MNSVVIALGNGCERRARLLPWGIEVQIWRLIDTRTLSNEAGTLSLSTLFADEEQTGAVPARHNESETTLENLIDEPTLERAFEYEYTEGDKEPK